MTKNSASTPSENTLQMSLEKEAYLTLSELAKHFKISVSTAKKLGIPFTRIGPQRRYPVRLVEKYALDHSTQPKAWEGAA